MSCALDSITTFLLYTFLDSNINDKIIFLNSYKFNFEFIEVYKSNLSIIDLKNVIIKYYRSNHSHLSKFCNSLNYNKYNDHL